MIITLSATLLTIYLNPQPLGIVVPTKYKCTLNDTLCEVSRTITDTHDVCTCVSDRSIVQFVSILDDIVRITNGIYKSTVCTTNDDCIWECVPQPHSLPSACSGVYHQDANIVYLILIVLFTFIVFFGLAFRQTNPSSG